jgi:hypothetical protein
VWLAESSSREERSIVRNWGSSCICQWRCVIGRKWGKGCEWRVRLRRNGGYGPSRHAMIISPFLALLPNRLYFSLSKLVVLECWVSWVGVKREVAAYNKIYISHRSGVEREKRTSVLVERGSVVVVVLEKVFCNFVAKSWIVQGKREIQSFKRHSTAKKRSYSNFNWNEK